MEAAIVLGVWEKAARHDSIRWKADARAFTRLRE